MKWLVGYNDRLTNEIVTIIFYIWLLAIDYWLLWKSRILLVTTMLSIYKNQI